MTPEEVPPRREAEIVRRKIEDGLRAADEGRVTEHDEFFKEFRQTRPPMIDRFEVRLPESAEWFDLWHTHIDWHGKGNTDPAQRRECIRLLFDAWDKFDDLASKRSSPWQSWLVLDEMDSGQDSLYAHTPNPNRDNFPYPFEDVEWGVPPPGWLKDFVTDDVELGKEWSEEGIAILDSQGHGGTLRFAIGRNSQE